MTTAEHAHPTLEAHLGSMEACLANLEGRIFELSQAVQDLRAGQRQILPAIVALGGVALTALVGIIAALIILALRQV